MTLVIGYADADIGFLVGDTLLSPEHFQLLGDIGPVNGEFHSLKIQIFERRNCHCVRRKFSTKPTNASESSRQAMSEKQGY